MSQVKALPLGWKWVKLGEVAEITSSKRIFQDDYVSHGIPFFRTKEVKELSEGKPISVELFITNEKYEEIKSKYEIPKIGDILISAVGTIGISYIIKDEIPFYFKDGNLIWIRKIKNAKSKFLNYQLEYFIRFKQKIAISGSAYNALTIIKLKEFEVPLPPLSIQAQIVEKLEALLSELDKGKTQLLTAQAQLKTYRQAVLKYAFEGKLTGDTEGWQWYKTGEVMEKINNGYTPKSQFLSEGQGEVPFIKVYNLNFNGTLNFSKNPTFIPKEIHEKELKRSICYPNDVLINIVGPPLGKVSVVPKQFPEWNINQAIVLFRPNEKITPKFLAYFLLNPTTIDWLEGTSKATAGQWNVKVSTCREIPINLPPLSTQQKIVTEIESRLSVCDKLEETLKVSLGQCETLRQSLLKRAFEGRLV